MPPFFPGGERTFPQIRAFNEHLVPADSCTVWLAQRSRRKKEQEAAALERQMRRPENFEAACARLVELERAGCEYAAWLLGDRLSRGDGLAKDAKTARRMLKKAAKGGIGAACWGLHCLDPKAADDAEWLLAGMRAGSARCARALAEEWAANRVRLNDEDAAALEALLLDAAEQGSWPCLEALLDIIDTRRELSLHADTRTRAAKMLMEAGLSFIAPAVTRLGREYTRSHLLNPNDEGADTSLAAACDLGSLEAACLLAERALLNNESDRAIRLLKPGCAKKDSCSILQFGQALYRHAADRGTAGEALQMMVEAARRGADTDAARIGWSMCLAPNAERLGMVADGLTLVRAAAEAGGTEALARLAHLRLLDLTGEEDSVRKGIGLLESMLERHDGRACGMLAEAHLFGLYGLPQDTARGFALAREGFFKNDRRSMTLLALNCRGVLKGEVEGGNPVTAEERRRTIVFLLHQDDALMHVDNGLLQLRAPAPEADVRESNAAAGQMLAERLHNAVMERDMAVLHWIAAGFSALGENERTRTAAAAFAKNLGLAKLGIRNASTWPAAAAFAAAAEASPLATQELLLHGIGGRPMPTYEQRQALLKSGGAVCRDFTPGAPSGAGRRRRDRKRGGRRGEGERT
ncbi:MAG: hypothetical protein Q4F72_05950 [Desulfovibrionaceae bacterium]|nr:hypothetical protein [Desulfovibrionaceae bacterium]